MVDGADDGRGGQRPDRVLGARRAGGFEGRTQRGIEAEIPLVVGAWIVLFRANLRRLGPSLQGQHVGAGLQQSAGPGQDQLAPRIIAPLVNRCGVEGRIRRRSRRESKTHHFHTIDPDNGRIIVHHPQEKGAWNVAGNRECLAQKHTAIRRIKGRSTEGRHVRQLLFQRHPSLGQGGHWAVVVALEQANR